MDSKLLHKAAKMKYRFKQAFLQFLQTLQLNPLPLLLQW